MLSNPSFVAKAPKEKIEAEKTKQVEYQKKYDEVISHISEIENK